MNKWSIDTVYWIGILEPTFPITDKNCTSSLCLTRSAFFSCYLFYELIYKHKPLKFLMTSFLVWVGFELASGERSWKWFPNEEKFALFGDSDILLLSSSILSSPISKFSFLLGSKSHKSWSLDTRAPFFTLFGRFRFLRFSFPASFSSRSSCLFSFSWSLSPERSIHPTCPVLGRQVRSTDKKKSAVPSNMDNIWELWPLGKRPSYMIEDWDQIFILVRNFHGWIEKMVFHTIIA